MDGNEVRHTITTIGHLRIGDHVCLAYDEDSALRRILASYVSDGLAAGQRVACYFGDAESAVDVLAGVVATDAAVRDGALIVGSLAEAYMRGGEFDPAARLREYAAMSAAALDDGYTGLRVFGQAEAMLAVAGDSWPVYELRADLLVVRRPMVALCAYDVRRCDQAALEVLRSVHARSFGVWPGKPTFHMHGSRSGALRIGGEIDFMMAPVVQTLSAEASRDLIEPVLDLSNLRFIDGAGMRAVVRGLRTMAAAHPRVRLHGASPMFRRLWSLLDCGQAVGSEVVLA